MSNHYTTFQVYNAYPKGDALPDAVAAWKWMLQHEETPPTRESLLDSIAEHKVRKWDGIQERYIPYFRNFLIKKMWTTYENKRQQQTSVQPTQRPVENVVQTNQEEGQLSVSQIVNFFHVAQSDVLTQMNKRRKSWGDPLRYLREHADTMEKFQNFNEWLSSLDELHGTSQSVASA